jgi:hypothetical protein
MLITLDKITFTWEDLIVNMKSKGKREPGPDMLEAAERAYKEGIGLLDLRASYEVFDVEGIQEDSLILSLPCEDRSEKLYIGPRISYLEPAEKAVIGLCTAGPAIVQAMGKYATEEEYLLMYYIDAFAVKALGELSELLRCKVEDMAKENGWGVGPSMQPGSVTGWDVSGQSDLYRLGMGETIGLRVNNLNILVPGISNSTIIGIGPGYKGTKVGSMCHECARQRTCLWRRENVQEKECFSDV